MSPRHTAPLPLFDQLLSSTRPVGELENALGRLAAELYATSGPASEDLRNVQARVRHLVQVCDFEHEIPFPASTAEALPAVFRYDAGLRDRMRIAVERAEQLVGQARVATALGLRRP